MELLYGAIAITVMLSIFVVLVALCHAVVQAVYWWMTR